MAREVSVRRLTLLLAASACVPASAPLGPDTGAPSAPEVWPDAPEAALMPCGTQSSAAEVDAVEAAHADIRGFRAAAQGIRVARAAPGTWTVHVHAHLIKPNRFFVGATRRQLTDQMRVLNDALGPHGFTFVLASLEAVENVTWYAAAYDSAEDQAMRAALHRGSADELNLYVKDIPSYLGYATYPWEAHANPPFDGILLRPTVLPGGASQGNNAGDTLVHEVGHWLGLYHVFTNECTTKGDLVADTPAQMIPSGFLACDPTLDSCSAPGLDPIANYMNYVDDGCAAEFTPGQVARMDASWATYRLGR